MSAHPLTEPFPQRVSRLQRPGLRPGRRWEPPAGGAAAAESHWGAEAVQAPLVPGDGGD